MSQASRYIEEHLKGTPMYKMQGLGDPVMLPNQNGAPGLRFPDGSEVRKVNGQYIVTKEAA